MIDGIVSKIDVEWFEVIAPVASPRVPLVVVVDTLQELLQRVVISRSTGH